MKKLFTTLSFVLGLSAMALAQRGTTERSTTEFDVTVGYNSATVTTSNLNADYRGGLSAGLGVEQYFSDSWGIKAKVLYDQKGWANGYYSTNTSNITTDYALDYVTVPLMADWHFGRTKNWYLNFGPYIGFLISAKTAVNNQDVKSYFNGTDGGLDAGIGVRFPFANKNKFFIEINSQSGVANINSDNSSGTIRNSASAINVGLTF